jgi:extracellular elastinolytic metalloproteinase
MTLFSTRLGYRALTLAAALAAPGLALAQQVAPAASLAAFSAKARAQGLKAADVADVLVTNSYTDASTGLTHTYLQQRVNGLVVFNATGAVHTDKEGKVIFSAQDFVPNAAARAAAPAPALTPAQAVVAASVSLGLPRPVGLRTVVEARAADGMKFNNGGISEEDIPVRLMYTRQHEKLVLVWEVTIAQLDQQHHWSARIDAQTGQLVDKNDYVVNELTTFRQQQLSAEARRQKALAFAPAAAKTILHTTATANSLNVVPVPYENPLVAGRSVVLLSSANPQYSPVGWQVAQPGTPAGFFADSYSLLSSGKFLTRGNNVAAYDDNATTASGNGSLNSPTNSPDGTNTLTFDYPFDQTKGPREANNLAAGITNLFYWNNMLHDVMMAHGFDEVSGNFQYKNLTTNAQGVKLGKDNDFVRAEAQDGSGRNNANFSTPADGSSGRMQMYLFDNIAPSILTIASPSTIAGSYRFSNAAFGAAIPKLTATTAFAGNIVVINDGVSADGGVHSCAAPTNAAAISGNIVLIQRGGCTAPASNNYTDKVKFAQNAGAVAAIIFDSDRTSTAPLSPGGADATVTIPVIGISGADGARIQAALANNALAAASFKQGATGPDFDGSFDSGVMSHEYGHGISNRLTGGGSAACLNGTTGYQTMGEGWSDYFGLWMTTRPGDIGSSRRYVGTYDDGSSLLTGPGFRTKPYTTDMSATGNNYTYAKLGSGTGQFNETHAVGEIWATVLWDLNWAMINKYGYNSDFFSPNGGNNKALKLVLDGCKLQVCQPGFLDGRDAILRADSATNRAANADLIWNVFARRGMGYGARQGDRVNGYPTVDNIVQGFDLPPKAKAVTLSTNNGATAASALEAFPNPAQDRLTVRTQLGSAAPIQVAVLDLLGKTVLSTTVPVAQMQQAGVELNTSRLSTGIYVVRVTTTEGNFTTKVTVQH